MCRSLLTALTIAFLATPAQAQFMPEKLTPLGEKIVAAMKSDIRTAEEKARDEERKPRQTLEFFGLRDDMRVVELVPSGGWFTKILAPVLAGKGELWVTIGTGRVVEPMFRQVPALAQVKVAPTDARMTPATGPMGLFDLTMTTLGVSDVDLALTFRNYHNFTPAGRANLNRAVFAAVKSGGHYGILDHTRRHNEPDNSENWRRVDPVRLIKEVQAAGFVLEDFSGLHFKPDDELRYEVGRKSVTGNTDRFMLLFRKP
ncbi:MAG: class I SAM-dependent methyltransferase [Gammaproteobacteria bacterium]|nr:class I SAM-dependent methyltransferase [Gammaproteobacteria bacterium]